MIKSDVSSDLGWKEEEDLAEARQKIERDLARQDLELDLHMKSVAEKIDKMVIETIKVKQDELFEQLKNVKEQEEEKRKENKDSLLNFRKDLEKLNLKDIEDWAFSRLCASYTRRP